MVRTIGACILASAIFQAVPAHTATYYVDTTGNNSNPGTEERPWRTVAHAVNTMAAGDTTYVRGGTYLEATEVWFRNSGTQSAPIKLLNYPGEFPIIDFSEASGTLKRIILQNGRGANRPIGWITIDGFEIRNGIVQIHFFNLHDSVIRRNWIHDSQGQNVGILGNGTRVLIEQNRITHIPLSHGIYANGTAITITNNLIYDTYGFGIQLNGSASSQYDPAKHAGPEFSLSADWVIAHNVIAYTIHKGGMVVWGGTCNRTRIENNIFYENGVTIENGSVNGIDFVATSCSGIRIRNNLSYASGSGAMAFLSPRAIEGVHYMQSGNIVNTDAPLFVNAPATLPASPNFALTERSPAIDRGLPLAITTIAFDGTTRPKGPAYDIGAYEYSTDGDAQSPAQVKNVQAR